MDPGNNVVEGSRFPKGKGQFLQVVWPTEKDRECLLWHMQ